jgi:uncharacterized membrane protein YfcA
VIGFVAMALAVAVGAAIQGTIGFGFALVAVPILALVEPGSVPVAVLVLSLPMTIGMAVRERAHADRSGFGWLIVGRVVGTVLGVAILTSVSADGLSVVVGVALLIAVAGSVRGIVVMPTPISNVAAGAVSGAMGTTSAIGGPALAVLYQRRPGPELRSTLAAVFVVGSLISLAALVAAGEVHADELVLAGALLPALVVGLVVGSVASRRLDGPWLRPAVLIFAAAAGALIAARGLL